MPSENRSQEDDFDVQEPDHINSEAVRFARLLHEGMRLQEFGIDAENSSCDVEFEEYS